MQILITIPDGVYSFVQEVWSDVDPTIETPLNHIMKAILDGRIIKDNDAISREALKKEVEHIKDTGYDTNNEPLFDFVELTALFKLIDNAPTIGGKDDEGR